VIFYKDIYFVMVILMLEVIVKLFLEQLKRKIVK